MLQDLSEMFFFFHCDASVILCVSQVSYSQVQTWLTFSNLMISYEDDPEVPNTINN